VLKQFSGLAVLLVGLLVLERLLSSIIQLGSVRALIVTPYGILLSIKLALVILLLGLAALNRFVCTPAVVADYKNTRLLLGSIADGMRSRPWHPCRGRRLALHAAAARLGGIPLPRRSRSISTLMPRCFRCWFRRARSAPTTLCCN
jgi:hypothetical protein